MRVDSFVFYSSFYSAISLLDDEVRLELYDAICIYALDHENPVFSNVVSQSIFEVIKPQIDANYQRRQNGKMGGRPMSQSSEELEDKDTKKPSVTKKKTTGSANRKPNVNVNANGNVNVNANEEYPKEIAEALSEFKRMRKLIKKPLTEGAEKRIIKKLDTLASTTEEKVAILLQSVDHSWQDVYPLKEERHTDSLPTYDDSNNPSFDQARFNELMERRSQS